MRRFLVMLLLLLFLVIPAVTDTVVLVYESDFSTDVDDWYARSNSFVEAEESLSGGSLRITSRISGWNCLGRDFDVIPGGYYEMSVLVRQDQADSVDFTISAARSADGVENYEILAFGTAPRGEWTELSGSFVAGEYPRYVLYVEAVGSPTLDFDIRDFRLTAPDGLPELTDPQVTKPVNDIPSLRVLYGGMFDIGICVPKKMLRSGASMALVESQFNIVTPENELKPESVIDMRASRALAEEDDTAVAVHFDAAKPLLDYAKAHGLKVHGHVLVWHSQTPEEFFHVGYSASAPRVNREIMLGRMEHYIAKIMTFLDENYPSVVISWDVVNEAIDDDTGALRDSPWLDIVGEDYLARAFEFARKYAPEGTLLYYNDYSTPDFKKQNGIVRLLESLMAEGNIDGYGFQMHYDQDWPDIDAITAAVMRIGSIGLRLRVSEMDITVDDDSAQSFNRQAEKIADIMRLVIRHSDWFEAVQFWGLSDDVSWRSSQYPLLFDAHRNPKPAFWAVVNCVE